MRTLIIEDDVSIAGLVRWILVKQGMKAWIAPTGEQGLEMAVSHEPQLVILDLGLPDMDGFEVLARLRSRAETAEIPVLILTMYNGSHREQRARDLKANGYMIKPFQIGELLKTVSRLLPK